MKFYYLDDDRFVGQRIAIGKYEPYETEIMLRHVKEGDTVIDVGANIGYYTLLLAQKVGSKGKVYAIEPEKTNFEILKKNIDDNGLKNIVLINAGAGDKEETRELEVSEENLGDHRIRCQISDLRYQKNKTPKESRYQISDVRWQKRVNQFISKSVTQENKKQKIQGIKIVKLDEVIKEKVNLIKIDTQGYEPFVIEGAKKIVERDKPEIILEYMPEAYEASGGDGRRMMEYLSKLYKNRWIIDDYLFAYYQGKLPIDKYCNNKKGYTDVWMSNRSDLKMWLEQYKNLRVKKLARKVIGLPETG